MLRKVLLGLGCLALAGWIGFYLWVNSLACAFSGPMGSRNCGIKPPWELRGEDLVLLVLIPGGITALIFLLAWLTGRSRSGP